jgi:hypothetical protein
MFDVPNLSMFRVFRGFTPRLRPCEVNGGDQVGALATKERKERKRGTLLRVPCVPLRQKSFPALRLRVSAVKSSVSIRG